MEGGGGGEQVKEREIDRGGRQILCFTEVMNMQHWCVSKPGFCLKVLVGHIVLQ